MWDFMQETNEKGTTIILTTHYLEEAESLCKNIAIINNGTLIEHTTMNQLLATLNVETFLLDLQAPLDAIPKLNGYKMELVSPQTLSVDVVKEQTLNHLFCELNDLGIKIVSMRNKSNRLEELFVKMTGNEQ